MRAWKAHVAIRPWEDGGYIAEVSSLQGCWVVAATPEEAMQDIREVIEMSIASRIRRGESLPPEIEEISSTEVRRRIAAGEPWEDLVPPAIAPLIR